MSIKRMIATTFTKRKVKKIATGAIEQQLKVLAAAVSTVLIHRGIQFLANRFPRLRFLRMAEDRTLRNM